MGNDVEGDALGELLGLECLVDEEALGLVQQFVHAFLAGARRRLIGRHHDALDDDGVVDRLQRHHHLDGRAVRVGDDAAALVAGDRLGVDLGHDQRHVGVHPPVRRVVDHDRAGLGRARAVLGRHLGARRAQHDVDALEVEFRQVLDFQDRFVAERRLLADRTGGSQRNNVIGREISLGQDLQHFATDIAGRADDGDSVAHDCLRLGRSLLCFGEAGRYAPRRRFARKPCVPRLMLLSPKGERSMSVRRLLLG